MGNTQESYKYRVQHLRGTSEEWQRYGNDMIPLRGELVVEFDDTGNNLHRLKIGDGKTPYDSLPYLSVDNFIMAKTYHITLSQNWTADGDNKFWQIVDVKDIKNQNVNITENSKVDLQPSAEQLAEFREKDLAFVTETITDAENINIYVYCIGQQPQKEYTVQATVTEVLTNA